MIFGQDVEDAAQHEIPRHCPFAVQQHDDLPGTAFDVMQADLSTVMNSPSGGSCSRLRARVLVNAAAASTAAPKPRTRPNFTAEALPAGSWAGAPTRMISYMSAFYFQRNEGSRYVQTPERP